MLLLFVACVVCMLVVWCGLRYLAWFAAGFDALVVELCFNDCCILWFG